MTGRLILLVAMVGFLGCGKSEPPPPQVIIVTPFGNSVLSKPEKHDDELEALTRENKANEKVLEAKRKAYKEAEAAKREAEKKKDALK